MHSMLRPLLLGLLALASTPLISQSDCGCNQCDVPIIANYSRSFGLVVNGASFPTLGVNGQGVCDIEIDFAHDFIGDLQITLTSPAGINVPLINTSSNDDASYFSRWKVKLTDCAANSSPDPGFDPVFNNNSWPDNSVFTGTYTTGPVGNCLSNFNAGPVIGDWYLNVTTNGFRGVGFIYGFKINFCKPAGIVCNGLNYETFAGEDCTTAAPLPPDITSFVGNTAPYFGDWAVGFCGTIENDQWYTFVSNCDTVGFQVTPGYCINGNGLQLALYDDCFSSVLECNVGCEGCGWSPVSIIADVNPGQQYYIVIDGWAGDQCDFIFDVPPGCVSGIANPNPNNFNPYGCEGGSQTIALTEIPFGAAGYIWKASNGALVNGQTQVIVPGPENLSVELTFGNGDGEICVAAYNFTDTTEFVCFPFAADTNLFLVENATVCHTDLPYFSAYEGYGVPPVSFPGLHQYYLQGYLDSLGNEYPCPVLLTLNLEIEGGFSNLPPVIGLGSEYVLPTGEVVSSSGAFFWSDTLASGCTDDHVQNIYLIDYLYNGDGCAPDTVTFIMPGTVLLECPGGVPAVVTGSGAKQVIYQNSGVYDLIGRIGAQVFPFEDTLTLNLTPSASAGFSATLLQNVLNVNNLSQNASGYLWDFGDGSSSSETNPSHTYAAPGTYTVSLTAFGGCANSVFTTLVTVGGQLPIAGFQISSQTGCAPFVVQYTDQSIGDPSAWLWDFPGGEPSTSTAENPVVTYQNPGTYTATLTIQNIFGQSSLVQTGVLTVQAPTVADFSWTSNQNEVTFTNNSLQASDYLWDFGDGSGSAEVSPTHVYLTPGTYTVTLLANGPCGAQVTSQIVTIEGQAPQAGFTVSQSVGCVPFIVQYQDVSTWNPTTWLWEFPGGTPSVSTEQHPTVTYINPGTYDATLTAQNAFGESTILLSEVVSASPLPTVAFSISNNALVVALTNLSQNADSYSWDFGDGSTSTEPNPSHEYATSGNYLITLQAINTCGTSILQLWVTVTLSGTGAPAALAWLRVSPNPSNGEFQLELHDQASSQLSWRLFNAQGQSLGQQELGAFNGNFQGNLDFRNLPAAVYWLQVRTAEKQSWVKLVVE